jgi:hypothetical protein
MKKIRNNNGVGLHPLFALSTFLNTCILCEIRMLCMVVDNNNNKKSNIGLVMTDMLYFKSVYTSHVARINTVCKRTFANGPGPVPWSGTLPSFLVCPFS